LEFAQKYQHWTVVDWSHVIFSDETKINRFGSDGRKWVWKKKSSPLTAQHVQPTVKFGGGSVMIWGCMTAFGVGNMCRIEGTMNAELYEEILEDEMLKTMRYYKMKKDKTTFQQDNDPKHTSKHCQKWFKDHKIKLLDWPAQSPDLNPIEHLWQLIKIRLEEYEEAPTSIMELWERVQVEWNKVSKEECINLIESMPRRIEAVLKAKGGHTKY
jgi:transposase